MTESTTIHVVVAFTQTEEDIAAETPLQMPSASSAINRAKFLAEKRVGVIAWSRTLNVDTGDYSDPVILARIGIIPDWFDQSGDAGG